MILSEELEKKNKYITKTLLQDVLDKEISKQKFSDLLSIELRDIARKVEEALFTRVFKAGLEAVNKACEELAVKEEVEKVFKDLYGKETQGIKIFQGLEEAINKK